MAITAQDASGQGAQAASTNPPNPRIGLALSGGGTRAAVFHLGVLRFLAEVQMLECIRYLSTVSGGSLIAALMFSENELQWPVSSVFGAVHDDICTRMTSSSLEAAYVLKIANPLNLPEFFNRANLLAEAIKEAYSIEASVAELPVIPAWSINGTSMEHGKRWHFYAKDFGVDRVVSMGDNQTGHLLVNQFPLADAVAASAAFPGGVTPYQIHMLALQFLEPVSPQLRASTFHIADGGVYDNLGLEPLFDVGSRTIHKENNCDYLIVVDAGKPLQRDASWPHLADLLAFSMNTIDIMETECRTLRARCLVGAIEDGLPGLFVNMGSTVAGLAATFVKKYGPLPSTVNVTDYLTQTDVDKVVAYGTNFITPSPEEFSLIERHGFEMMKVQWLLYGPTAKRLQRIE